MTVFSTVVLGFENTDKKCGGKFSITLVAFQPNLKLKLLYEQRER